MTFTIHISAYEVSATNSMAMFKLSAKLDTINDQIICKSSQVQVHADQILVSEPQT